MKVSVEVRFLWKGATRPSDDDVGGVMSGLHALIQRLLLDEFRQEACIATGKT